MDLGACEERKVHLFIFHVSYLIENYIKCAAFGQVNFGENKKIKQNLAKTGAAPFSLFC